jgi:hypothetical protein
VLAPQTQEIRTEVIIEMIGSAAVWNEHGERAPRQVAALKVVKPRWKTFLTAQRYEVPGKRLPCRNRFRIRKKLSWRLIFVVKVLGNWSTR